MKCECCGKEIEYNAWYDVAVKCGICGQVVCENCCNTIDNHYYCSDCSWIVHPLRDIKAYATNEIKGLFSRKSE